MLIVQCKASMFSIRTEQHKPDSIRLCKAWSQNEIGDVLGFTCSSCQVHADNGDARADTQQRLIAAGITGLEGHRYEQASSRTDLNQVGKSIKPAGCQLQNPLRGIACMLAHLNGSQVLVVLL